MCFATGLRTLMSVPPGKVETDLLRPRYQDDRANRLHPWDIQDLGYILQQSCVAIQISAPRDTKCAVRFGPKHAHECL